MNRTDVYKKIKDFEDVFAKAIIDKADERIPREFRAETSACTLIKVGDFFKLYVSQKKYPEENLEKLVEHIFDLKRLCYFNETLAGLYNSFVYLRCDSGIIDEYPSVLLNKIFFDQILIIQNRIIWEKWMNLVYLLETGNKLKASSRKSKETKFFREIEDTDWSYLKRYKKLIEYIDGLRTPEVHDISRLQAAITSYEENQIDFEKVNLVWSVFINELWPNLLAKITGKKPRATLWKRPMEGLVEKLIGVEEMITYEDFQKVELRIGKVVSAEKVPETDRLLKLEVDFGDEKRQIVSGIAEVISVEEIVGQEFPFILNLEPRTIKGIESQGMILAANDEGTPVLIHPAKEVPPGSVIK